MPHPSPFAASADAVAARLRARALRAMEAVRLGHTWLTFPLEQLWSPEDRLAEEAYREARPAAPSALRQQRGFLKAANDIHKRLRLWAELSRQTQEIGDVSLELPVLAVWEADDAKALDAYDTARAELLGQVPLPMGAA